jgi:nitroimidazol reductase NimA-like FMN-containing flavoprotein (pyridoxamine 5'-phosphate oxidase superfamily)
MEQTTMGATPYELPHWEILELLGRETVGRLCVIEQGYPLAFPLNYRMMREADETRIVFRAAPHAAVARYEGLASLEDGFAVEWQLAET